MEIGTGIHNDCSGTATNTAILLMDNRKLTFEYTTTYSIRLFDHNLWHCLRRFVFLEIHILSIVGVVYVVNDLIDNLRDVRCYI